MRDASLRSLASMGLFLIPTQSPLGRKIEADRAAKIF